MNPRIEQRAWQWWFPWGLVLVVAWIAHAGAWMASFYMDDYHHILMNPVVRGEAEVDFGWKGRFLTFALWRGVYAVWGPETMAFHGLNWLLHGAVAVTGFGVMRGFLRLGPDPLPDQATSTALWGALLFAVHPLCVEPIHYAAQTSILLATFLALLAGGAFLRWKVTGNLSWAAASLLGVLLSGMAKEAGFWHALIGIFFMALLGHQGHHPFPALGRSLRGRLGVMIGLGVVGAVVAHTWLGIVLARLQTPDLYGQHLLTQARVLGEYVSRMFVPLGLCSDHHVPWTVSWTDTDAVFRLLVTAVAAFWILERYGRRRSWLAALLGMGLFHMLIRFAYVVDEPMVEYRTYPAMPWIALFIVVALRECTDWRFPRLAAWTRPVLAMLVLGFALLTWQRSRVWQDERSIVTNVLGQYPLNLRALGIYMKNLTMRGEFETVIAGKRMPDEVSRAINDFNRENDRIYSERRQHLDYASCQYFIIRAQLHAGQTEAAAERAQAMLADLLTGRRAGNDESHFSAFLSRALCHVMMGEREAVDSLLEAAHAVLPNAEELPEMLQMELGLMGREMQGTSRGEELSFQPDP